MTRILRRLMAAYRRAQLRAAAKILSEHAKVMAIKQRNIHDQLRAEQAAGWR